jgi:hypothetical protein
MLKGHNRGGAVVALTVWYVGCTTTCATSVYHYSTCEFEPRKRRGVLDTTLCDKVRQLLATGRWCFSVSSINTTDRHDIAEILLKVGLNTIKQINNIMDEYGNMLHIQPLIDLQSSSKNGSHLCSTRLLKTVKYQ